MDKKNVGKSISNGIRQSFSSIKKLLCRCKEKFDKNDGKWQKYAILILCIITLISIAVTLVVVKNSLTPIVPPEFAPIEIDRNAEKLSDSDNQKMEHEEGGGAVSLVYSKEVSINLSKKSINLLFQNPSKSTQDMVLQLVLINGDEEIVIAQSDKLPPGFMLKSMELLNTAKLSIGGYSGKFNVLFYAPDTGERAIVNTNIPVTITVK